MKKLATMAALVLGALLWNGCARVKKHTVPTGIAQTADAAVAATARTYAIDTAASIIYWEGTQGLARITNTHTGSFNFQNGSLLVKDNKLVAGNFVIDIHSIQNFDLKKTNRNALLINHLKSADFFDAARYPTAAFELVSAAQVSADSVRVTGNLTLKGVTKSLTFPAKVIIAESGVNAHARFYINRKDWGMHWQSEASLGDGLIRPEVGIELKIVTR